MHQATVQKISWRALNALAAPLCHIPLYDRGGLVAVKALVEIRRIELQIRRVLFQFRLGEGANILTGPDGEQLVVILPELALEIGAFGCLRRPVRFADLTLIDDWIILVSELDLA